MSTEKGIQQRKDKREANRVHKAKKPEQQKKIFAGVSDRPNLLTGNGPLRA